MEGWRNCELQTIVAISVKKGPSTEASSAAEDDAFFQEDNPEKSFLSLHGFEAAAVELQQVLSILLGSVGRNTTLEAEPGRACLAVRGGGGNELHQVERDVLGASC